MSELNIAGIRIEVIRKNIKYMHLYVLPPDGRVRITAPRYVRIEDLARFAESKLGWIRQKQSHMKSRVVETSRQYITGETLSLWGREYPLNTVQSTKTGVRLEDGTIYLYAGDQSTPEQREAIINGWYRKQLEGMLPGLFAKWESIIGVKAREIRIRNMKTRWGTCNVIKKRVWINLQLAKKPFRCLEYVVVHELVHLLEKSHSSVFKMYMSRFLPEWKSIKRELNGSI